MTEALRCRNGDFNNDTIMDYIGFACGICGAGNTLVFPYHGRIFRIKMTIVEDLENAEQSAAPVKTAATLSARVMPNIKLR